MGQFTFLPARLEGLYRIEPFFVGDERGCFVKSFERDVFREHGLDLELQESFETFSRKGVLRGLHFQRKAPQGKLVRALQGRIFDVAVDLRRDSDTFGQWEGFMLDDEEHSTVYIPPGFAHGFLVVSETAQVSYQCTGAFLPREDAGVIWSDPDLGVSWPLDLVDGVVLSPRDQTLPSLEECIRTLQLPLQASKI